MKPFVRLAAFLMKVLGFGAALTGCSLDDGTILNPDIYCEYGCPRADYEIKGKVQDADGNPLSGIQVGVMSGDYAMATALSGSDGSFVFDKFSDYPFDDVTLCAQDIDLLEGGGYFGSKTVTVKAGKVSEGDDNWFIGVFAAEAEITMSPDDPALYGRYYVLNVSGRLWSPAQGSSGRGFGSSVDVYLDGQKIATTDSTGDFNHSLKGEGEAPAEVTLNFVDGQGRFKEQSATLETVRGSDPFDYWCDGIYGTKTHNFYLEDAE